MLVMCFLLLLGTVSYSAGTLLHVGHCNVSSFTEYSLSTVIVYFSVIDGNLFLNVPHSYKGALVFYSLISINRVT